MRKGFAHLIGHRDRIAEPHLLRQVTDGGIGRHGNLPGSGMLQSGDNLEHSRFTGTVAAYQGYAVTPVDDIVYIIEERFGTELYA